MPSCRSCREKARSYIKIGQPLIEFGFSIRFALGVVLATNGFAEEVHLSGSAHDALIHVVGFVSEHLERLVHGKGADTINTGCEFAVCSNAAA